MTKNKIKIDDLINSKFKIEAFFFGKSVTIGEKEIDLDGHIYVLYNIKHYVYSIHNNDDQLVIYEYSRKNHNENCKSRFEFWIQSGEIKINGKD